MVAQKSITIDLAKSGTMQHLISNHLVIFCRFNFFFGLVPYIWAYNYCLLVKHRRFELIKIHFFKH